jgi:hypothetical protein
MTLAMSRATESDSGLASGLVNTSVQVGGAVGLAVLATLATERTDNLVADGEPATAALVAEPEPVPEVPAEPVPGAATEPEGPSFRVKPLPAYTEAQVAGCQETGMRVVIGCAGSAP